MKAYPFKAVIQYNHTIHSAAQAFQWDNVYRYNKEFCMHLSNFPIRSWGVILQQAWTMCMRDRLVFRQDDNHKPYKKGKKEVCKRFNKGLCTAGLSCKYDHRCLKCGKFGHGEHICQSGNDNRKLKQSNSTNNSSQNADK